MEATPNMFMRALRVSSGDQVPWVITVTALYGDHGVKRIDVQQFLPCAAKPDSKQRGRHVGGRVDPCAQIVDVLLGMADVNSRLLSHRPVSRCPRRFGSVQTGPRSVAWHTPLRIGETRLVEKHELVGADDNRGATLLLGRRLWSGRGPAGAGCKGCKTVREWHLWNR